MPRFSDRVKDTTATTGTGNITLDGTPASGYEAFSSAYATGTPRIPYAIVGGSEWEVGYGTLSGATTLTRDKVLASSNSDAAVSFSAGSKDVFVTWPSQLANQMMARGRIEMARLGAAAF